ncbi:MAG TPA: hypothetical protein VHC41_02765, partial [Mycobacteriales bacterium]|nr:hypothetical protein [Mycobacteriales bacterium]
MQRILSTPWIPVEHLDALVRAGITHALVPADLPIADLLEAAGIHVLPMDRVSDVYDVLGQPDTRLVVLTDEPVAGAVTVTYADPTSPLEETFQAAIESARLHDVAFSLQLAPYAGDPDLPFRADHLIQLGLRARNLETSSSAPPPRLAEPLERYVLRAWPSHGDVTDVAEARHEVAGHFGRHARWDAVREEGALPLEDGREARFEIAIDQALSEPQLLVHPGGRLVLALPPVLAAGAPRTLLLGLTVKEAVDAVRANPDRFLRDDEDPGLDGGTAAVPPAQPPGPAGGASPRTSAAEGGAAAEQETGGPQNAAGGPGRGERPKPARAIPPTPIALANVSPIDQRLPFLEELATLFNGDPDGPEDTKRAVPPIAPAELNSKLLSVLPELLTETGYTLMHGGVALTIGFRIGNPARLHTPTRLDRRGSMLMGLPTIGAGRSATRGGLADGSFLGGVPQGEWTTARVHSSEQEQMARLGSADEHRGEFEAWDLDATPWVFDGKDWRALSGSDGAPLRVWINAGYQQPVGETVVYPGAVRDEAQLLHRGRLTRLQDTADVTTVIMTTVPREVREQVLIQLESQERSREALRGNGFRFELKDNWGKVTHVITLRTRIEWYSAEPTHAAAKGLYHGRGSMAHRESSRRFEITRRLQGGAVVGLKELATRRRLKSYAVTLGVTQGTGSVAFPETFDTRPRHTYRVKIVTDVSVQPAGKAALASTVPGEAYFELASQDAAANGLPVGADELTYDENGGIVTQTVYEPIVDEHGVARTDENGVLLAVPRQVPVVADGLEPPVGRPGPVRESGTGANDEILRLSGLHEVREFIRATLDGRGFAELENALEHLSDENTTLWATEALQDGYRVSQVGRNRLGSVEEAEVEVCAEWDPAQSVHIGHLAHAHVAVINAGIAESITSMGYTRTDTRASNVLMALFDRDRTQTYTTGDSLLWQLYAGTRLEYRGPADQVRVPLRWTVTVRLPGGETVTKTIGGQFAEVQVPTSIPVNGPVVPTPDGVPTELLTDVTAALHVDARGLTEAVAGTWPAGKPAPDVSNATLRGEITQLLTDGLVLRHPGDNSKRTLLTADITKVEVTAVTPKVMTGPFALNQDGQESTARKSRAGTTTSTVAAGPASGARAKGGRTVQRQSRLGGPEELASSLPMPGLNFKAALDVTVAGPDSTSHMAASYEWLVPAPKVLEYYANGEPVVLAAVPAETIDFLLRAWAGGEFGLDARIAAKAVLRHGNPEFAARALELYPTAD